jgi:hypothetical protein
MTARKQERLDRLVRALGSLRLAVLVLGLLAAVLATATIYEARYGSRAAQRDIYEAPWFAALLVLLGVNVAAAALTRWPWRLKQIGFVTTHMAILLILGGCLTTRWMGINGRLVLAEGRQDDKILQDSWIVQATAHGAGGHGQSAVVPISEPPRLGGITRFDLGGQTYSVRILAYLDNAASQTLLEAGAPDDPPGALVELAQPEGGTPQAHASLQWLLVDDRGQWAVRTPGFTLAAASTYTAPVETAAAEHAKGTLVALIDGKEYEADVERALAEVVPLPDQGTTVHVTGYYEHASVDMAGKIEDDPERPINPAVILELSHNGKKERRIIFARFGDISEMHGGGQTQAVKMIFRHPRSAAGAMQIVLVPQQDKWVLHEDNGTKLLQEVELKPEVPVSLKGMPVLLTLKQVLAHARASRKLVRKPLPQGADPQPAIEVEVGAAGNQGRDWLVWSQPATFALGEKAVRLTFGSRQVRLPFTVKLNRFELEHYAGSDMPAMYRSEVTVMDAANREQRTVTVEMNKPLEYKGWSFFQSGYSMLDGEKVSILAASMDPGRPIVYAGAILLVIGTAILTIQRLLAQVPKSRANGPAAGESETAAKTIIGTGADHA